MPVLTLTVNPALDKSTTVSQVVPDHKLKCKAPKFDPGGGGINVARVVKRLNGDPLALLQSSGPAGLLIQQQLENEKIKYKIYGTREWTRENFIVTDESSNQQYRFGMPGPTFFPEETEACSHLLKTMKPKPEFLVLSGSLAPGMPDDFYASVCRWAKGEKIKIVLDTSGAPLVRAMQEGVFLVKPNLKELSEMAGKKLISGKEQEDISMSFIKRNLARIVVVSLGPRGAMMASEKGIEYLTPPAVISKSTVGAGDSMVGGMVWALSKGHENSDVLKYGIACGTAATLQEGTELCKKKDVDEISELLNH